MQWDQHVKEVECLVENGKRGVAHEGCRARVILKPMVRHDKAPRRTRHTTHGTRT